MKHLTLKTLSLIGAALLAAGPAMALSCLRPDPAATFQSASASTDVYVVLRGSFAFDAGLMPAFDGNPVDTEPAPVAALFSGNALGPDGFTLPYETELLLQPSCAGPWCGGLVPTGDAIAFARDNGEGVYVIDLGPCGGSVFEPTDDTVATIVQCMTGGACAPNN
jgi:hypothetical protein